MALGAKGQEPQPWAGYPVMARRVRYENTVTIGAPARCPATTVAQDPEDPRGDFAALARGGAPDALATRGIATPDDARPDAEGSMRTTVTLDDDLLERAAALTGTRERSGLLRQALEALIERESARRLARLGGSEPDLVAPPRRRGEEPPPTGPSGA
jgi:Arc/MetJ family transcription regulator